MREAGKDRPQGQNGEASGEHRTGTGAFRASSRKWPGTTFTCTSCTTSRTSRGRFKKEFDALAWENDETLFTAWKAGRTGYPIVDAAMRQLNTEAWMHNRGRMIVASFLTKDLLIDWRWGERYFMEQLVDGDQAANNGGWQWAAGTGTDPQPFFRIFNPVLQGKKFDPDGTYVRRWVPELRVCRTSLFTNPGVCRPPSVRRRAVGITRPPWWIIPGSALARWRCLRRQIRRNDHTPLRCCWLWSWEC